MLWEVDIYPRADLPDRAAERIMAEAAQLGLGSRLHISAAHGYLLQGELSRDDVERLARQLLVDGVVERATIGPCGDAALARAPVGHSHLVHVLPKPGVMDPVANSVLAAMQSLDDPAAARVERVRTLRKYWVGSGAAPPGSGTTDGDAQTAELDQAVRQLCQKVLANDAIEQVVVGPLLWQSLEQGAPYRFALQSVALREMDDAALMQLSRSGQLYLSLAEMRTIAEHFRTLQRDPTDAELETLAQTWSEHCSHKTLAGRVRYTGPEGTRQFDNMLKQTIFAATDEIRRQLGERDWCVSVFRDNAGVVRFDDEMNVVFKVETHNHPSALEPYGGANTGVGGVVRDPLGTGLGAKPICNTDVFCFAPPDTPADSLPPGVLHPKRVMKGVVSGVRDYGNRMGIPTVNGAIYFDPRYLGNPLVYCGTVGILPHDKSFKEPQPGDLIVAVGGRTGRDGIHGATFSSAELTSESESLSGGAVQIGNAITEKMVLDVILAARDQNLYTSITDCGAGGFSSAVGEMGEKIGAEVHLERIPLKYEGLTYTEMWISEAQERMVLSVPEANWDALHKLCAAEGVEATAIGRFEPTGRLRLLYEGHQVADLSMAFLHDGRPPVVREANYLPAPLVPLTSEQLAATDYTADTLAILGSLDVASKEWVIRQYDHEVQGASVVKPLVGIENDGPGDAAVLRPRLDSRRGIVVSCGMTPRYGDLDTYHMATSAIDEALRNCVAVGADPSRVAILDNFCWGDCERAETLGSLVRAALACQEAAVALGTPFISGKDSLNNEFRYEDAQGNRQTISIPPSLLISALGQIDDVSQAVTMDLKAPGNLLYQVGSTHNELGGSQLTLVRGISGGAVPEVDLPLARRTFAALHRAIRGGAVRACHDLSEGGLAVALAEMAFAGGYGVEATLASVPHSDAAHHDAVLLFSQSNTRFVCEVSGDRAAEFEAALGSDVPFARIGQVVAEPRLTILGLAGTQRVVSAELAKLKAAWQAPLRW